MRLKINVLEILILTIIFAGLAIWSDVFRDGHVMGFITNHVIALAVALLLARVVYHFRR